MSIIDFNTIQFLTNNGFEQEENELGYYSWTKRTDYFKIVVSQSLLVGVYHLKSIDFVKEVYCDYETVDSIKDRIKRYIN